MRHLFYFLILAGFGRMAFATVGGAETIQVMGYDAKDEKVYFTRHYQDQSGRVPQLYYYQLNSKQPDQVIEVKSIYQHIDRNSPRAEQHVEKELKKIQSRLIPLQRQKIKNLNLNITASKTYFGHYCLIKSLR